DPPGYNALGRMVQPFSLRYPLVDGQGNFGSMDGDPPAAYRYATAQLTRIATELLADIEKNTVDMSPNFDDELKEPVVLPARVPNLLANGASGIAVGMATNIPPHNLAELCDAVAHLIDHPEVTMEELAEIVRGPSPPAGSSSATRLCACPQPMARGPRPSVGTPSGARSRAEAASSPGRACTSKKWRRETGTRSSSPNCLTRRTRPRLSRRSPTWPAPSASTASLTCEMSRTATACA